MKNVQERGITLISLVITIIVLMILAGISIGALTGEDGIITKTELGKEDTRAGEVRDKLERTLIENEMAEHSGDSKKTRTQLVNELAGKELLKGAEIDTAKSGGKVKIGQHEIDFSVITD